MIDYPSTCDTTTLIHSLESLLRECRDNAESNILIKDKTTDQISDVNSELRISHDAHVTFTSHLSFRNFLYEAINKINFEIFRNSVNQISLEFYL